LSNPEQKGEILRYAQDDRNTALLRMTGKDRFSPSRCCGHATLVRNKKTKAKPRSFAPLRTTNRNRVLSVKDILSVQQGGENSH
jgi:hypothetical protein